MATKKNILLLLFVSVLALVLRAPGVPWGLFHNDYFEPDEGQHIAIAKNLINTFDKDVIGDKEVSLQSNGRGFGTQVAVVTYPFLKVFHLPPQALFLSGRIVSLIYSLLLIVLIYLISLTVTRDNRIAFLSSLLLSVFDLNVTYSHYAVPDIGHAFWDYLSVFLLFLLYRHVDSQESSAGVPFARKGWLILLLPLSLAMSLSFRFDPVPLVLLIVTFGVLLLRRRMPPGEAVSFLVITLVLTCGFFYLSVGFNYTISDFFFSRRVLAVDNFDVVPRDTHVLHNPVLYFFAILSGTSLPVVAAFLFSLFFFLKKETDASFRKCNLFFSGLLLLSFLILWSGDATAVRRANIFLPYIAMMSASGLVRFVDAGTPERRLSRIGRAALVSSLVVYTLLLSLISQRAFLSDTRYKAGDYLNEHFPSSLIAYSYYARTASMPPGISLGQFSDRVDLIVLHETYYTRYWKSFVTPFRIPRCCDEVYHCIFNDCILIQDLMANKSNFEQIRTFEVRHVFPERVLFKYLFGTYETFVGDVRIYRRIGR